MNRIWQPVQYFITLKHRNHLTNGTAIPWSLTGSSSLYDFSSQKSQFADTLACKELNSGIWGLAGGDINQNGLITSPDYVLWYHANLSSETGYIVPDLNLDAIVNDGDFQIWQNNARAGHSTAIE